jgi:hypothetical protein
MKQEVVVHVPSKKYAHMVTLTEDFADFVGKLVAHTTARQTFELFGCDVVCPALTNNNDGKIRTFVTLVGINNAVFGDAEQDQIFGEDTKEYAWFELINRVGTFGQVDKPTKQACYETFKGWKEHKAARKEETSLNTIKLNAERTAETVYLKAKNKALKAEVKETVSRILLSKFQFKLD